MSNGEYEIPDSAEPLYSNASITVTATLALLFSWFSLYPGISKEAFSHLLCILHHFILPHGNQLPASYSSASNLVKNFLVPTQEYHCCVNDCVIFRGTTSDCLQCPQCQENRYLEDGKTARKKFKYLPLGPRIRRLFSIPSMAKLLQSHQSDSRGTITRDIHDTETWKKMYSLGGVFKGESRGVSFALCADGTNPFSKEKYSYSMWPLVLSILNLPSHLRRLPEFLQLIGIIPGKSEPKNIDPYLEILVDELLELNGSVIFDAHQKCTFTLIADIFLHVLDYPGQNKLFHCHGE